MTKLVQVTTVDNFDNSIPAVETITFVYNGVAYTLDLGEKNLAEVREVFRRYAAAADRVGPATVTVQTDEGTDVLIKPRTKVTRPKSVPHNENNTNGHVAAPEPPAQPTLLEAPLKAQPESPPGLVAAITQAAKALNKPAPPAFTSKPGARAATPEPPQAEPPDDGLPPSRSWLHITQIEKSGTGQKERARRGTAYRNAMRDWLRANGYPDLAIRGKIAEELIDAYWRHVLSVRASTMEPA